MYFTVFTPTYNRAYILENAYKSLVSQTFKDFKWVIMDDGSVDNTEQLVRKWIREEKIYIEYYRQKNQGRFSAYNNAIPYFEGELWVPLDSDDMFMPETLEVLFNRWENREHVMHPVGIVSCMQHSDGKLIGSSLPQVDYATTLELNDRFKVTGDKHKCYLVSKINKYQYPVFKNEKFIGDSLLQYWLDSEGPLLILNKSLYIRDYPEDSLTVNIEKVHYHSPNGMAEYYREVFPLLRRNFKKKWAYTIKYVSFCKIANRDVFTNKLKQKWRVVIAYIPGLIYAYIIKEKGAKNN